MWYQEGSSRPKPESDIERKHGVAGHPWSIARGRQTDTSKCISRVSASRGSPRALHSQEDFHRKTKVSLAVRTNEQPVFAPLASQGTQPFGVLCTLFPNRITRSETGLWETYWERFIEQLPDDKCVALVQRMGLPVPGFRKGARNIPAPTARKLLRDAPARREGEPFLKWFRKDFGSLLSDLEHVSDGDPEKIIEQYIQKYPPGILPVALAMIRPDLLERWKPLLEDKTARQGELTNKERIETLQRQISALSNRLMLRERELDEARRREKGLEQEKRKLEQRLEELSAQFAKLEREAAAERTKLHSELSLANAEIQTLRATQEQLQQQKELLIDRVARYRDARRQDEVLLQLYRSLTRYLPETTDDVDQSILVIGETFPAQYVRVSGKRVRIEAVAAPTEVDEEFISLCGTFDNVVMLSSCPHKVRLRLYRQLGGHVTEIGGLHEFASLLELGEASS